MLKRIALIFIILTLLLASLSVYLNKVFLPKKIKNIIITGIEQETQKKVSLEALKFSIFKGLVLEKIKIYDDTSTVVSAEEASCIFLIWPIFKKQLIIPTIRIKSAHIFVERRSDNTFNIARLFKPKTVTPAKGRFNILVQKIRISKSRMNFQDNTIAPSFSKSLQDIEAVIYLSLPASVKFSLKAQIPSAKPIEIIAQGQYNIPKETLSSKIQIQDFSPKEFEPYYRDYGINFSEGVMGISAGLTMQNKVMDIDITVRDSEIKAGVGKIVSKLKVGSKARLKYGLENKEFNYSGQLHIREGEIFGLDIIENISRISGTVDFNNSGISCDKLSLNALNMPVTIKFNVSGFPLPSVQLEAAAPDLSLKSAFSFKDKAISISECKGAYLNSQFSLTGSINTTNPDYMDTDVSGNLGVKLEDLKVIFKKQEKLLQELNPAGDVQAKFSLAGNIKELKSCAINAELSGAAAIIYGLKAEGLLLNYSQGNGVIQIPSLRFSLYGGSLQAAGGMNLNPKDLPYWIDAGLSGVKIEKLKMDTASRGQDISGTIEGNAKINGFGADLAKTNGAGKISISEGRLWELNLFKGLGKIIFAKDHFSDIVFSEGSADFIIGDKSIASDNLKLKGEYVTLTGQSKIGFDGALDMLLNVEVSDEFVPLSGTFKDITTAIVGLGGRFGKIKVSGTLKEPKYKFSAAVMDILNGLKSAIMRKIEKE